MKQRAKPLLVFPERRLVPHFFHGKEGFFTTPSWVQALVGLPLRECKNVMFTCMSPSSIVCGVSTDLFLGVGTQKFSSPLGLI